MLAEQHTPPSSPTIDQARFDLAFNGLEVGVRYAQEDLARIRNQILRLRHDWSPAGVGVREAFDRVLNELDGAQASVETTVIRAAPL